MAISDIQAWLKVQEPYQVGLALLQEHGSPDEATLFILELGETSVSRARLVQQLREVLGGAVQQEQQRPVVVREHVTKAQVAAERATMARGPGSDGYEDADLPEPLQALRAQVKDWYKEMAYLHSRLDLLPSDQDRLRSALRIDELDGWIVSAYARLDTWKETGRDPGEAPKPSVKSGADLRKELGNLRSWLSKVKHGRLNASEEKVRQRNERLAEVERLLEAQEA